MFGRSKNYDVIKIGFCQFHKCRCLGMADMLSNIRVLES